MVAVGECIRLGVALELALSEMLNLHSPNKLSLVLGWQEKRGQKNFLRWSLLFFLPLFSCQPKVLSPKSKFDQIFDLDELPAALNAAIGCDADQASERSCAQVRA